MSHESQSRPAPGGPCNPRPLSPKRRSSVFSFGFLVLDPGHADAGESFLSAARLFFYSFSQYDIKNKRTFLKRCPYDSIERDMLYIGAKIVVYSRQLTIVDFADTFTRNRLQKKTERTCAMIKPDAFLNAGKIVNAIVRSNLRINQLRMCKLTQQEAAQFYAVHSERPFYPKLVDFMSSGPILAIEIVGEDAIAKWRSLLGPTNSETARAERPDSIRAKFGTDNTMNAAHGSDSDETATTELDFFFGSGRVGQCANLSDCTLCIIKPSALVAGYQGLAIDQILQNFNVTAMELFRLDRANAGEFFEVYKGVVPEYNSMVDELISGDFIAIEISESGGNPVSALREFCGPADPEIARVLRPKSLRAQFGVNKVQNAIHCTDLPEDGELESNYFFNILIS